MKTESEYRALARETLKGQWTKMALLTLLVTIITFACILPFEVGYFIGQTAHATALSVVAILFVYVAAFLISVPLSCAFNNVCLANARREESEKGSISLLFSYFIDHWAKYVGSYFLIALLIFLAAIPTLMIGAFILAFAYALVPFIIRDNPEISIREALRTSRKMMDGHKPELFFLYLTFIGWYFLSFFTLYIGNLWLTPYITTALAHFYEDVKAEYEAKASSSQE